MPIHIIDLDDPDKVLIPVPRALVDHLGLSWRDEIVVDTDEIHQTLVIHKKED